MNFAKTPNVCMLTAQDHTRHPIIRRQVATLVEAGYTLSIVDRGPQSKNDITIPLTARYHTVHVRPVSLGPLGQLLWVPLSRFRSGALGEAWWTAIHFLGLLLASINYAFAAVRVDADYYQAHDLETLLPAIVAAKLRRRSVIYDAHELTSEQGDSRSLRKRFERVLESWFLPWVNALVVPNRARGELYVERFHLRCDPTIILNCPPSCQVERSNLLREQLRLPSSTQIVLYHGIFMAGRALEELVLAARSFDENIVLVMMGEQNAFFRETLLPLWQAEEPEGRVFFVPFVEPDQIMPYVASADLGVVIYKNVSLNNYLCAPTKLYEYIMARVPVVACDFPVMRELLDEYPIGFVFDSDDPVSIADAVNRFFRTDSAQRDEMARTLGHARQRFNWEHESQELLQLLSPKAVVKYAS